MLDWYNVLINVKEAMDPIQIRLTLISLYVVRPDQNKMIKIIAPAILETMKLAIREIGN